MNVGASCESEGRDHFDLGRAAGVVFFALLHRDQGTPGTPISADQALTVIRGGQVAEYRTEGRDLVLLTSDGQAWSVPGPADARVWQALAQAHVAVAPARDGADASSTLLWIAVGAGVVVGLVYLLRKSRGGAYGNIFALRGTKARPIETADKARFTDVGGNRQAVELLADLVDFLRAPQRWLAAGLRIPRGILLVGPPGTGKTLLARAVAGETQAAFFYTSAAEFVEMFVGIGAARVRGTFEKAAAQQPAVIFIDELDAIGRRRGSGSGTVHEEREQTFNQLLVMLDGIERHKRLVVMAATNRPDILDPALLRSGRFDRVLRLETPKLAERIEILKIRASASPWMPACRWTESPARRTASAAPIWNRSRTGPVCWRCAARGTTPPRTAPG